MGYAVWLGRGAPCSLAGAGRHPQGLRSAESDPFDDEQVTRTQPLGNPKNLLESLPPLLGRCDPPEPLSGLDQPPSELSTVQLMAPL